MSFGPYRPALGVDQISDFKLYYIYKLLSVCEEKKLSNKERFNEEKREKTAETKPKGGSRFISVFTRISHVSAVHLDLDVSSKSEKVEGKKKQTNKQTSSRSKENSTFWLKNSDTLF